MRLFADVLRARLAELNFYAFSLMNVPTEEVFRLVLLNELEHRMRPGVEAAANLIERRAIRRCMANQNQWAQIREAPQPVAQLRFAILARRVERSRIGIPESGHLPFADLDMLLVKIMQPETRAHVRHLVGRL